MAKVFKDWVFEAPTEPNGVMPVNLGWCGGFMKFEIIGGPYDAFRRGDNADFGVCVRAESCPEDLDVLLPIRDFQVPLPEQKSDVEYVLRRAFRAALDGKRVWVGCQGGWGRTGLFLALMAKVAGYEDPVGYVRRVYAKRACETNEQCRYVYDFDAYALRSWLYDVAWYRRVWNTLFWWMPA